MVGILRSDFSPARYLLPTTSRFRFQNTAVFQFQFPKNGKLFSPVALCDTSGEVRLARPASKPAAHRKNLPGGSVWRLRQQERIGRETVQIAFPGLNQRSQKLIQSLILHQITACCGGVCREEPVETRISEELIEVNIPEHCVS